MPPAIRLAVFGHPVAHSLSPRIHAAFGRQLGLPVEYRAIEATADAFGEALERFAAAGGVGANVTLPLKELAFERADRCTARARRAGAVNTLRREAGAWLGDNTDGAGLVRDLRVRHGLELRGLRTLVIGAGGAARGVAPALLDAGIAGLTVANRTFARAAALAEALDAPGRVLPRELGALDALGPFDLIVNASSAARGGALPDLPDSLADARTVAVDLGYGEAAVPFLAWAQARGAGRRIDGLGMLVEQAADSFALWCGVRPGTDAIHAALSADTAARPTGT